MADFPYREFYFWLGLGWAGFQSLPTQPYTNFLLGANPALMLNLSKQLDALSELPMNKKVKIGFVCNTELDTYEIYIEDHLAAQITIGDLGYHDIALTHDTPGMVYKAIAILWEEFERRDEFTDFTMEVDYLAL